MHDRALRTLLVIAALSVAVQARAEYFRVGPDGEYATIQAALTAAAQTPAGATSTASHDVRVQSGTYLENLRLPFPCCGGRSIRVSGGWNATFSSGDTDPTATVVDGRDRGRVFFAGALLAGAVTLDRLVLREGYVRTDAYGYGAGAGIFAMLGGTARLNLLQVHVRDNVIRGEGSGNAEAQGAGAVVFLSESARLQVTQSRFQNNLTVPGDTALASYGGGLYVDIYGEGASATIRRSEFVGNWAYGSRQSYGGGVFARVWNGSGTGFVAEDSLFQGNVTSNTIGEGTGLALRVEDGNVGSIGRIARCRFVSNLVGLSQLSAVLSSGTRVVITDSLVAKGRGGVKVLVNNSVANLANLTVADNQLRGVQGSVAGGFLTVSNTIAYRNAGGDLSLAGTQVVTSFNLVGIDPMVLPGSYELGGASPAADAGTNVTAAGLGLLDLARRDRVYNGTVDIGAYEWHPF